MNLEKLNQLPNNPEKSRPLKESDKLVFNQSSTKKKEEIEKKQEETAKQKIEKTLSPEKVEELRKEYIELLNRLFRSIESEDEHQVVEKELDNLQKILRDYNIPLKKEEIKEITNLCARIISASGQGEATISQILKLAKKYNLPLKKIIKESVSQAVYGYKHWKLRILLNEYKKIVSQDLTGLKEPIQKHITELLTKQIPRADLYSNGKEDILFDLKQILETLKHFNIDINLTEDAVKGLKELLRIHPELLPEFLDLCNHIGISLNLTDTQIMKTIKETQAGKNGLIKLLKLYGLTNSHKIKEFIYFCRENKIPLDLKDPDLINTIQKIIIEKLNIGADIGDDLHSLRFIFRYIPIQFQSPEMVEAIRNRVEKLTKKDPDPWKIRDFLEFLASIPAESFNPEISTIAQKIIIHVLSTYAQQFPEILGVIDHIPINLSKPEISIAVQEGFIGIFSKRPLELEFEDYINLFTFAKRHNIAINFADPRIIKAAQHGIIESLKNSSIHSFHKFLVFIKENIPIDIRTLEIPSVIREFFDSHEVPPPLFTAKLMTLKNYYPVLKQDPELKQEIVSAILDAYKHLEFRDWNDFINAFYNLNNIDDDLMPGKSLDKLFLIFIIQTRHIEPRIQAADIEELFPIIRNNLKEFLNKYAGSDKVSPHLLKKIYEKIPLADDDTIYQLRQDAIELNNLNREFILIRDLIHNAPGKINLDLIQKINAFIDSNTSDEKILKEKYLELKQFWDENFSFMNDQFYSFKFLKEIRNSPEAKRIFHRLQLDLEKLWKNDAALEEKIKTQMEYIPDSDISLKKDINHLLKSLRNKDYKEIAANIGKLRTDISRYLIKNNKNKAEIYILDRRLEQLSYIAYAEYLNHPKGHNLADHIKVLESILLSMKADHFYDYNALFNELLKQIHANYLTPDVADIPKWKAWVNKLYRELADILSNLRKEFESYLKEAGLHISAAEKEQLFSEFFRNRSLQFLDGILKQINNTLQKEAKKNKEEHKELHKTRAGLKEYLKDRDKKLEDSVIKRLKEKYLDREGD